MRETVGSLKLYFIIIGRSYLILSSVSFRFSPLGEISGWIQVFIPFLVWGDRLLGLAYLGVGIEIKAL